MRAYISGMENKTEKRSIDEAMIENAIMLHFLGTTAPPLDDSENAGDAYAPITSAGRWWILDLKSPVQWVVKRGSIDLCTYSPVQPS